MIMFPTIPLPTIGGNGIPTVPTIRIDINPARVPEGRHLSNLRQGLLRPQSEVGMPAYDTSVSRTRYLLKITPSYKFWASFCNFSL